MAPVTFAQTPDGHTPANEGVCDALQGLTPGLYGLCVAFCEAQDFASLESALATNDLEALEDAAPSGRLLANYNKKMKEGDPPMPCIRVIEPCPCWTADELAAVDGLRTDGNLFPTKNCLNPTDNIPNGTFQGISAFGGSPYEIEQSRAADGTNPYSFLHGYCLLHLADLNATFFTFLSVDEGTLTPAEADSCAAAHQTHFDSVCP